MLPIIYVLKSTGLCGGVRSALEQASGLLQRGYDCRVYFLYDPPNWFNKPLKTSQFASLESLKQKLVSEPAIKVATWFETAYWVRDTYRPQDRLYYLIQDIEESYAGTKQQVEFINSTYLLGLKPLTISKWIENELHNRFGQKAVLCSIGIDFDTFKPIHERRLNRDKTRILAPARVSSGVNLKGWHLVKSVAENVYERDRHTSLVTFGLDVKQNVRSDMPHIHIQHPDDKWLNEIYNESGLLLVPSKHEGFGLIAAEAMATKLPVVATRAQGNEEFCIHNKTAMLADYDDVMGLTKHVMFLLNTPDFAEALATNAYEFIQQYNWKRVIDTLETEFTKQNAPSVNLTTVTKAAKVPLFGESDVSIEYPTMRLKPATKELSVIIPTVNDAQLTERAINSIVETVYPNIQSKDFEIVVVDDGTKDQSILDQLNNLSGRSDVTIHLVKQNANLGVSHAFNTGILNSSGKYIVLCNNDIQMLPNWYEPMKSVLLSMEKVAIVGAKLIYANNALQHAGVEKANHSTNFLHTLRNYHKDFVTASDIRPSWAVTGALVLINRDFIEQIGGFSTAYQLAYEDVDYCLKAWISGWKVMYCGKAEAIHHEGLTRGSEYRTKSTRPLIWRERESAGRSYFNKKWIGLSDINSLTELVNYVNS